jgi:hypothetical protein
MRTASLAALVLILGCAGSSTDTAALRQGRLRYTGHSPAGTPVLTGGLELAFPDDSTVTGTWAIAWLPEVDTTLPVGPQVGSGTLVGRRSGDTLQLQMNPEMADNNVSLTAVPSPTGYTGTWSWSTFAGPRSSGTIAVTRE